MEKEIRFSADNHWDPILEQFRDSSEGKAIRDFLQKEQIAGHRVFPPPDRIFRALALTEPEKIKVVILGQDPYHGAEQADGLAFSTPREKYPPSLKNIFREAFGPDQPLPLSGSLEPWAAQGVLLLNSVLTVREKQPLSHIGIGWESLTRQILSKIDCLPQPICFFLWGNSAKSFRPAEFSSTNRAVFESAHPSPLSAYRGFFGCGHFLQANEWLRSKGVEPPDWNLP